MKERLEGVYPAFTHALKRFFSNWFRISRTDKDSAKTERLLLEAEVVASKMETSIAQTQTAGAELKALTAETELFILESELGAARIDEETRTLVEQFEKEKEEAKKKNDVERVKGQYPRVIRTLEQTAKPRLSHTRYVFAELQDTLHISERDFIRCCGIAWGEEKWVLRPSDFKRSLTIPARKKDDTFGGNGEDSKAEEDSKKYEKEFFKIYNKK